MVAVRASSAAPFGGIAQLVFGVQSGKGQQN
jgi:hypothetical protein